MAWGSEATKSARRAAPRAFAVVVLLAALTLPVLSAPLASAAVTWSAASAPLNGLSPSAGGDPNVTFGKIGGKTATEPEACPVAGWCVAVGSYQDANGYGYTQGLIETLANGAWRASAAPLNGLNPAPASDPNVDFSALTCPVEGSCVAVGDYADAGGNRQGLIETLSGGTWTPSTAPLTGLSPTPFTDPLVSLVSLSCLALGACIAVGTYNATNGETGLIETLANGAWRASTAPLNGLSTPSAPRFALDRVACYPNGPCVAVGQYQDSSNATQGLIETLSGGTWTPSTAPISGLSPAVDAAAPQVSVKDVSCPAATWCVASGSYDATSGVQGLIETLSGGTWTPSTAPISAVSPAANSNPLDTLDNVSCPVVGSCVAVSSYDDSSGYTQGLIETLSGGTWTSSTAPISAVSPAAATNPVVSLNDEACTGSDSCVVVGSYTDNAGSQQGLIETLSGGTWTSSTAPISGLSPTAGSDPMGFLTGVSCPTVGSCTAVGGYQDSSGNQYGLIETQGAPSRVTCTWTDGGHATNDDWSNAANWSGIGCTSGPPVGAALIFPSPVPNGAVSVNDLAAGTVVDSLTIEAGYTLAGNQVTLDPVSGTGITATGTVNVTIAVPIVLGASQTFSATDTTVDLRGVVSDAGQNYGLTLSGYLWSVDPHTAGGAAAANTYAGATLLDGNGYTSLGTDAGLGSGPVTIASGSTLAVASGLNVANAITMSGDGMGGDGAVTEAGGTTGAIVSGPVILAGDAMVEAQFAGRTLAFTGGISGGYLLQVNQNSSDEGTVVVSAPGTYSTGTTVAGGILQVTNAHALGSGPVTVDSGATIQESGGAGISLGNALTLNGAGATNSGAHGALEALSASDGWTGSITLGSASSVAAGASNAVLLLASGVSGTGPLTLNAPASGAGGMVELINPGTYSGGTIVAPNATTRITSAQALSSGAITVDSGGELQVDTIASLDNALHLAGSGVYVAGPAGALEWFGANLSLTQPLTLDSSASVVNLGNDGHSLTLAAGIVGTGSLSTSGTVLLPQGQDATNTQGLEALEGTLQVDGTTTSQVTAANATVDGSGDAAGLVVGCNATLRPGAGGPGILTTTSGLSLGCVSGSVGLALAIHGTTPGSGYSQVVVRSGTIGLDGATLSVNFESGFTSTTGDVYDVVSNQGGGAVAGVLDYGGSALSEGATFTVAGRTLRISYVGGASHHDVTLTDVTSSPPPPPPPPSATSTATALSSSTNPTATGQTLTYTATVSPTPDGGAVTFYDNGSAISGCLAQAVSPSTGQATCVVIYPSRGSHPIDAAYSGDRAYGASSSPSLIETVSAPAPSAVTFSANPSVANAASTWSVAFTTSSTGALGAGGTITIAFAADVRLPSSPTVTLGPTYTCATTSSTSGQVITVTLVNSSHTCNIPDGSPVVLRIPGITNPPGASYATSDFGVATSVDTTAAHPTSPVVITAVGILGASAPSIVNLPVNATFGASFNATVSTNGDGVRSITSSTPNVCTVNGFTVRFVGVGTCALTAHVSAGRIYAAADGSVQNVIVGQGIAPLAWSPSPLALGRVVVGRAGVTRTLTLANQTDQTITLGVLTSRSGASRGNWKYEVDTSRSTCHLHLALAGGARCVYVITFSASTLGAFGATMSLGSTDATGSALAAATLAFTGQGIAPLAWSPSPLALGRVVVGRAGVTRTLTLANQTDQTITLGVLTSRSGASRGNWKYEVDTSRSTCHLHLALAGGARCVYVITFSASTLGAFGATMSLGSTDATGSALAAATLAFTGQGIAPLAWSPSPLALGRVVVGRAGVTRTLTLANQTDQTITLGVLTSRSGASRGNWRYEVDTSRSTCHLHLALAGGARCVYVITFSASTLGAFGATMSLGSTDATGSALAAATLAFTGQGIAPLAWSPSPLALGRVVVGRAGVTRTLTLANQTDQTITLGVLTSRSGVSRGNWRYEVDTSRSTCHLHLALAGGARCVYVITFSASTLGAFGATMSLGSTDATGSALAAATLAFTGQGIAPLAWSPSPLALGRVVVGRAGVTRTLTLANQTDQTITLGVLTSRSTRVANASTVAITSVEFVRRQGDVRRPPSLSPPQRVGP